MITFKQFLSEEVVDSELRDLLEHDCAQFLTESKRNGFLLRGIRNIERRSDVRTMENPFPSLQHKEDGKDSPAETSYLLFWEREVRQDRQPVDMSTRLHKLADDWFDENFGFRARSQALFCADAAGKDKARTYGPVHLIFPVGAFKYVWSPNVIDLYRLSGGMTLDFLSRKKYTDAKLDEAVTRSNEIMVSCRKYYAFEYRYMPMLEKLLRIS